MPLIRPPRPGYDTAEPLGNPAAEAAAIRDRTQALKDVNLAQASLGVQMRKRMPNLNFSRRDIGMFQLWNEQIHTLGPLLESFANDKNVTVEQAKFQIAPPPSNPNSPVFDEDVLKYELGTVQVEGNFKSIMDNIRRWNNCRRLVMVSKPPELAAPARSFTLNMT